MCFRLTIRLAILTLLLIGSPGAQANDQSIILASTTSTHDSGLFGHILPLFKAKTGITVKVLTQGTGQALDTARRGDADVVLVHAKAQEEQFVADGFGVQRFDVMYNDFVLVGPLSDPAGIKNSKDIAASLTAIHRANAPFVSRGDKSGTHVAELALWKAAGLDPAASKPSWYREIGQGMGTALNTANAMGAYVLSDRGTWAAFSNKQDLRIVIEGDPKLLNQYGVILVNPARHPAVRQNNGQTFINWLLSVDGQNAIRSFQVNGEMLFTPNARPRSPALRRDFLSTPRLQ